MDSSAKYSCAFVAAYAFEPSGRIHSPRSSTASRWHASIAARSSGRSP